MKRYALLTLLVILPMIAQGQSATRPTFEQFYDLVLFYLETGEEQEPEELESRLRRYYDQPIDWNRARKSDLDGLLIVGDEAVDELLYYAYRHGPVRSLNELYLVPKVDMKLRDLLMVLLTVNDEPSPEQWTDAFRDMRHTVVARADFEAERRWGYSQGAYPGLPFRQLVKYKAVAGENFSAGITMETDAGEQWGRRGFDLYRLHTSFSNIGVVERIVAGSMRVAFGNGLVFGGLGYGAKSAKLRNNLNRADIRGYAGTSEDAVLNGVALKLSPVKGLSVTALYGYSPFDATITAGTWRSVNSTGYHHTVNEIMREYSVGMHTVGGHIAYENTWLSVGATGYGGFFSLPNVDYGRRQWAASLDYAFHHRGVRITGETSITQNLTVATTNSLIISPLSDLSFALNFRYLPAGYNAFWANSFAHYSRIGGETGVSFSAIVPLAAGMQLDLFADLFSNLRDGLQRLGYELRAQYTSQFDYDRVLTASFLFRQSPEEYLPEGEHIKQQAYEQLYTVRAAYRHATDNGFRSTTGFQFSALRTMRDVWSSPTFGFLLHQDLDYTFARPELVFKARMELFDARAWGNRLYLYESNIAESSYSPALYGQGFRWYFIVKYTTPFRLTLQARVAQTIYADRAEIGSGNDRISGRHRTEFNILLSYKFKNKQHERRPASL